MRSETPARALLLSPASGLMPAIEKPEEFPSKPDYSFLILSILYNAFQHLLLVIEALLQARTLEPKTPNPPPPE